MEGGVSEKLFCTRWNKPETAKFLIKRMNSAYQLTRFEEGRTEIVAIQFRLVGDKVLRPNLRDLPGITNGAICEGWDTSR